MDAIVVVVAVGALLGNAAAAAWIFESATPVAAELRRSMRRRSAWAVAVPVAGAALAFGVPYAYVNTTDDAPEPLQFSDAPPVTSPSSTTSTSVRRVPATGGLAPGTSGTTLRPAAALPTAPPTGDTEPGPVDGETTTTVVTSEVSGRWVVGEGSVAGYRAEEILVVENKTTVGRTSQVTGELLIDDRTVREARFTVDMASVRSDDPRRDAQYRGRIMATDQYPTSQFVLTQPIVLAEVPPEDEVVEVSATGDFTIRGVTKTVTFPVQARRHGGRIEVLGQVPVVWRDYGIPDPSQPLIQVEDHGVLEFLLLLDRAAP